MSVVTERADVDETYTWDLERIYPTPEAWEDDYETVSDRLPELAAYEGRVTEDAATLLSVLELRDELQQSVETVFVYARMRSDEDTADQSAQAMAAKAGSLLAEMGSVASFVDPEVQSLTREEFETMLGHEPELSAYEHYVDDVLRMKEHTRSAEIESLLADLSEVTQATSDVFGKLSNADMTFPTVEEPGGESVEITNGNFTTLLQRSDREFRQTVYEAYYDEWETVRNAIGSSYAHSVKADVKLARIRNYETAREAALDGSNVPVEVYDALVESVRDNLPALHRHAELKRQAIGADELRMWDLYVPVVEGESPEIPYDEAAAHVVEAVAPLGEGYQSSLAAGLDDRWIDVYETPNKRAGAYSGGSYDTDPYVLMNYQDDVASMFTLAHELGHSLHSVYTREHQPYVYSRPRIFIAEVASTVNEVLLTHHLLETLDDEYLRAHVLNEFTERIRSTLFRQTMFAEFEHEVHRLEENGEALTPDRLDALFGDLKGEYYEPAVIDDQIRREWMRIPHFYRAFYVFQYATGISAAVAIARDVLESGEGAAAAYREFLSQGSNGYPLDILEIAGVDMRDPEPVDRALGTYERYVDELDATL